MRPSAGSAVAESADGSSGAFRQRCDHVLTVTIQLPADISAALGARWDDVPRRSLEAIALEGYRTLRLQSARGMASDLARRSYSGP